MSLMMEIKFKLYKSILLEYNINYIRDEINNKKVFI